MPEAPTIVPLLAPQFAGVIVGVVTPGKGLIITV